MQLRLRTPRRLKPRLFRASLLLLCRPFQLSLDLPPLLEVPHVAQRGLPRRGERPKPALPRRVIPVLAKRHARAFDAEGLADPALVLIPGALVGAKRVLLRLGVFR